MMKNATLNNMAVVWQTCPHCNGKGKEPTGYGFGLPKYLFADCSVCNGQKIISMLTGRPPISETKPPTE